MGHNKSSMLILLIITIIISSFSVAVSRGVFLINPFVLRRQAQQGNKDAKLAYPFLKLKYELLVLLTEINIIAISAAVTMLDDVLSGISAVLLAAVVVYFAAEIVPLFILKNQVVFLMARCAPLLNRLINITAPLNARLARPLQRWMEHGLNAVYSRDQLIKMFEDYTPDHASDISTSEASMVHAVLLFRDKKIRDIMTPQRMVKTVSEHDALGPVFLDELYRTGHSRFPVTSEANKGQFVGTLYIRDLTLHKHAKIVHDLMSKDVRYIHEEESIEHALQAFLKTRHHLFLVVNTFEEFVGVLSIEDVLEELIGTEIVDEFDRHDDLRAVAKSLAEKEAKTRHHLTHAEEKKAAETGHTHKDKELKPTDNDSKS